MSATSAYDAASTVLNGFATSIESAGEPNQLAKTIKGDLNQDAAWFYPATKEAANNIEGYVAFWKGVKVE